MAAYTRTIKGARVCRAPDHQRVYHDHSHCKACTMNIIFVLIPIAILFVIIAGAVFFWAIRSEQFEDLDRQGSNILFDEDKPAQKPSEHTSDDRQP